MKSMTIGMDVAKSVFEIAVSAHPGRVSARHRVTRSGVQAFFRDQAPATVLMEGCSSAHYWARQLQDLGHRVVLLPAHQVRPYVPRNKTDRADAKGLLEAYRNEAILPIPVKSVEQQAVAGLHRLRAAWMETRTARLNALRGLLREFGVVIPVGARQVVPKVEQLLADPEGNPVPKPLRVAFDAVLSELRSLEERIREVERQLRILSVQNAEVHRLTSIPGVAALGATALVAMVGDIRRFPSGRHFASYLGLTPREHSSGSVRRLGRISKRGDSYLRGVLLMGSRAVLRWAKVSKHPDRLQSWAVKVERERGPNKAAIALANKLARIVWAVWKTEGFYEGRPAATECN